MPENSHFRTRGFSTQALVTVAKAQMLPMILTPIVPFQMFKTSGPWNQTSWMELSPSLFTPVAFLFTAFFRSIQLNNTCAMFQLCVDPEMKQTNSFGTDFIIKTDLVLLLLYGLCSTQSACTSSSDKTDFATSRCIPPDCWGFADMLMVTTTEGMLNGLCEERKGTSVWGTLIYYRCRPNLQLSVFPQYATSASRMNLH